MSINLAEAVKLKSILTKRIQELQQEMHGATYAIIEKGATPTVPSITLAALEAELAEVRKDSRKLDALIYRANIDHKISFRDEEMPIVEAIELASQLRAEAAFCKELGQNEKESFYHGSGEIILYRVTLFEPHEYRTRALELEKQAHRLSNAINAANYSIEIDFDDTKYF